MSDDHITASGPSDYDDGIQDRPPRRPAERPRHDYDDPSRSSGLALTSMILGLSALVFCITAVPALILGIVALVVIGRSEGRLGGKGMAWTGIVLGALGTLALPATFFAIQRVRTAAERMSSSNNLKMIGLAMHNHNDQAHALPPAAIATRDGKPGLSWRVALLPYVQEDNLYRQFKLDEPWDSPHNMALLSRMPKVYRSPGDPQGTTDTPYRVFVGKDALFDPEPVPLAFGGGIGRGKRSTIQGIADGPSNTILVVEASEKVPWTKPDELEFSMDGPLPPLGYVQKDYFLVLMADGSVRTVSRKEMSDETLRNLITPREGKPVRLP